jgi:chromosome partitioning protein
MQTTTFANQKGGVGKTADACILAHSLVQHREKRVLAIDLDHQGNFSKPIRASGKAVVAPMFSSQLLEQPWEKLKAKGAIIPEGQLVLIPSDADKLMLLERQGARHSEFATNFRNFILSQAKDFDACIIDTNPNPDIRLISALVASDFVISPIQLNQEAIDGIGGLLNHPRVGIQKIRATLNPRLELIGLLPSLVEPTPFQRRNLTDIVALHASKMIRTKDPARPWAYIPKRSAIAEAQSSGELLWEMKKTAGRDTWREIEPAIAALVEAMKLDQRQAKP